MAELSAKPIRTQLDTLVGMYLPTLAAHYAYRKADFGGLSPVACVTTGSNARPAVERLRKSLDGTLRKKIAVQVHLFSLRVNKAGTWTEQQAEDELDDLEAKVGDMVVANPRLTNYWNLLTYDGATEIEESVDVGGNDYRHAIVYLMVDMWP